MKLENLEIDIESATDGAWFPFPDDCKIKIASWQNKSHKKFLRETHTKYGRKLAAKMIDDNESDRIMAGQWPYIIRDWTGIEDANGDVEYSEENVLRLASDKRYEFFFEQIEGISREEENFRTTNIKAMGED